MQKLLHQVAGFLGVKSFWYITQNFVSCRKVCDNIIEKKVVGVRSSDLVEWICSLESQPLRRSEFWFLFLTLFLLSRVIFFLALRQKQKLRLWDCDRSYFWCFVWNLISFFSEKLMSSYCVSNFGLEEWIEYPFFSFFAVNLDCVLILLNSG